MLEGTRSSAYARSPPSAPESTAQVGPPAAFEETRAPPAQVLDLPKGTELGRYVVLERLGQGGMGVVFTAYDPRLHRRIAIKLLHPGERQSKATASQDAQARLVREAQALAQLSHPNIISVFDVGTFQDQVFMAMELVDGESLRARLKRSRPSWREAVGIFRQAGEGLRAAHAAGLVHRDFKPDNMLLANSGRVFVMDFGLARAEVQGTGEVDLAASLLEAAASPVLDPQQNYLDTPLSRAGVVSGTLPYLAPEQLTAAVADARTDQFSFCVALYETLYGVRPFSSAAGKDRWSIPPRPPDVAVPAWLRQLVLKGLSIKPEERFSSMDALLAQLGRDPAARWRRAGWAAAAVATLAAVGVSVARRGPPPCQDVAAPLAAVWGEPQAAALRAAFLATGHPSAEALWTTTAATLKAYAGGWSQMRAESCEATRVLGAQSDEVLSLRMMCLDRRLRELDAMVSELRGLERAALANAPRAAAALLPLATCSDVEQLKAPTPLPPDPTARAQVLELQYGIAQGRALHAAGKMKQGVELATALIPRTRAARYAPVEAEALELLALQQDKSGQVKDAAKTAEEAVWAGVAAGDKRLVVRMASLKLRAHALLGELDVSAQWAERARSTLQTLKNVPIEEGAFENQLGVVEAMQGHFEEAVTHLSRARDLWTRGYGAQDISLASVLSNLAGAHHRRGQHAKAIELSQESLRVNERWLGSDHPQTLKDVHNLALTHLEDGQVNEAEPLVRRAFEGRTRVLGANNPLTGQSQALAAWLLGFHGDYARALEQLEQSHAIVLAGMGRESGETLQQQGFRAEFLGRSGKVDEALALQRSVLAAVEKLAGDEDEDVALGLGRLVHLSLAAGRRAEAVAAVERLRVLAARKSVVPLFKQQLLEGEGAVALEDRRAAEALRAFEALRELAQDAPAQSASRVPALLGMGRALELKGDRAQARALLSEGLQLAVHSRMAPDVLAPARFALARLVEAPDALELAKAAREGFVVSHSRQVEEVDSWLRRRPSASR